MGSGLSKGKKVTIREPSPTPSLNGRGVLGQSLAPWLAMVRFTLVMGYSSGYRARVEERERAWLA